MLEPKHPEDFKPEIAKDQRLFIVVPYRAMTDKGFTIQRMRALLACCSYANHQGTLWPSVERLADDLGIQKATMQHHIHWLTQKGYLVTINNSYQVGKHAKPRAVVYDKDNPPNPDDQRQLEQDHQQQISEQKTTIEQRDKLIANNQSGNEVLAKPASLYRVWREALESRYGITPPYDIELYAKLSHRYTLEGFKKATQGHLNSVTSPPSTVKIMLRC